MTITYNRSTKGWDVRKGKGQLCCDGKSRTCNGSIDKEVIWSKKQHKTVYGRWEFKTCYNTSFTLNELKKIVEHMEKLEAINGTK